MKRSTLGFTLIEMMIVIAVIGILGAIVMAKYNKMILRSREANVKGSLGSLRSAISIYYSDTEGFNPTGPVGDNQSTLLDSLVSKYLPEIPACYVYPNHTSVDTVDNAPDNDFVTADPSDDGEWVYVSNSMDPSWGVVGVECYHADSKGAIWTSN